MLRMNVFDIVNNDDNISFVDYFDNSREKIKRKSNRLKQNRSCQLQNNIDKSLRTYSCHSNVDFTRLNNVHNIKNVFKTHSSVDFVSTECGNPNTVHTMNQFLKLNLRDNDKSNLKENENETNMTFKEDFLKESDKTIRANSIKTMNVESIKSGTKGNMKYTKNEMKEERGGRNQSFDSNDPTWEPKGKLKHDIVELKQLRYIILFGTFIQLL
uniref:Uncharacterized protein n=1 Tax=Cacopsylla melanoneura TaxID=428564 RepID=A0A8D8T6L1_9HEMI